MFVFLAIKSVKVILYKLFEINIVYTPRIVSN